MSPNDTAPAPAPARSRAGNITLWAVQILLAAFFLLVAVPKLAGQPDAVQVFTEIGAGQWFRYLVGVLEVAGAIGLLVPRLAAPAALGLVGVMAGAVLTHLVVLQDPPVTALTPAILGVVLGLIAWLRRSDTTVRA